MMCVDIRARYGIKVVFACLRITTICDYGHYAQLPGSIEHITCQVYSVEYMSKIKFIFSIL